MPLPSRVLAHAWALMAAAAAPSAALAADVARKSVGMPIGTLAANAAAQLPGATKAVEGASLLGGAYLGVMGLAGLRAASSAVPGAKYASGAWKLAVGSGLAMLPLVADSATRTAGLGGLLAARLGLPH